MTEDVADADVQASSGEPMRTSHRQRDRRDVPGEVRVPGASVVMTSDVSACEDVTIVGQVHGTIDMKDHVLTIAEAATVTAPVSGGKGGVGGTGGAGSSGVGGVGGAAGTNDYADGTTSGVGTGIWAGGGGGGGAEDAPATGSGPATGGGGRGGWNPGGGDGLNGTLASGGGGGGAQQNDSAGGNGGSGAVVVRWAV